MRWLGLFRNKTFRKHLKLIILHWDFIICIVSLEIFHPYFVIRIFPSAFYHPHFSIRIFLSAIRHPPSAIRRHPVLTLQRPLHKDICQQSRVQRHSLVFLGWHVTLARVWARKTNVFRQKYNSTSKALPNGKCGELNTCIYFTDVLFNLLDRSKEFIRRCLLLDRFT